MEQEMVSKGLYDQIKFERDIAIEQLKMIGAELGMVMDGFEKIVYCKDCLLSDETKDRHGKPLCRCKTGRLHDPKWFCADGVREGDQ